MKEDYESKWLKLVYTIKKIDAQVDKIFINKKVNILISLRYFNSITYYFTKKDNVNERDESFKSSQKILFFYKNKIDAKN